MAAPPPASGANGAQKGAQKKTQTTESLGNLYTQCVQMVNENKISAKNAWDLDLIEHMDDVVDIFMGGSKAKKREKGGRDSAGSSAKASSGASKAQKGAARESKAGGDDPFEATEQEVAEHRFHEASCTIEASARIYAARVDCVHVDTYRVLGGLNSADTEEQEKDGEDGGKAAKKRRICGVNTLEKNEKNIVQASIEADEQSDPGFRRMAAQFDAGGAKGLLLSHLPIAEDLSLVFNGDVPLVRAAGAAKPMFSERKCIPSLELGLGDPSSVSARLSDALLCPEVDGFRRQLFGNGGSDMPFPDHLEELLGSASLAGLHGFEGDIDGTAHPEGDAAPLGDALNDGLDIGGPPDMDDMGGEAMGGDLNGDSGPGASSADAVAGGVGGPPLPLLDVENALPGAETLTPNEEAIAFDELFEKFCSGGSGSSHQFAYFDESWSKLSSKQKGVAEPYDGTGASSSLVPHDGGVGGQIVPADSLGGPKERGQKRPLFDLSGLERPARPIETEPAHKHQLSEKAAAWQLHKDVPPYMIDRITMPSWPSWSKCDFACLGLRPHLMLKLVKKPQPPGEGPHNFGDLFSTAIVENPDAFPWLASEARAGGRFGGAGDRGGHDDIARAGDASDDEDFDGNGLPAHLDADPYDLFLKADDKVIPGCDEEDFAMNMDDDGGFGNDMDLGGLADEPSVPDGQVGYSRNSKFVDVKLVKKHLWDCISDDISAVKEASGDDGQTSSSFQGLVHRMTRRMRKEECENLSVQVGFICLLHLCNEKGMELKTDSAKQLGDFTVVAPWPWSTPNK